MTTVVMSSVKCCRIA